MEDKRFASVSALKKKELPYQLQWFFDDDYFSDELFGFTKQEIEQLQKISQKTYALFEAATTHIIENNKLSELHIPTYFHKTIIDSWNNRHQIPFLVGRMDINGGLNNTAAKVIEFNADTCTTMPETIHWQKLQGNKLNPSKEQFNHLLEDLTTTLSQIKQNIPFENPMLVASSFGHKEDVYNCHSVLEAAGKAGFKCLYEDLEKITFSASDGIFVSFGDEYEPVDVWFKLIPWDWIIQEEKELAELLAGIIQNKKCIVLNPPFTAIWQNKLFLAYITEHFPNSYIAETYTTKNGLSLYVEKPVLGRMGENVTVVEYEKISSKGDFANQQTVFQKYYPLLMDNERYYYQIGCFYTNKPSALNLRAEKNKIITNDCEFMSHYII